MIFMKYHIFYFWDAQNLEKNEIVLRQARKVVGPKAPGSHRAHGPRPLRPKLRQQPGPGPPGSWAGPAWFKMLLGLGGGARVVGWGKGVISCTSSITFHLVPRKIYIYSSILTF